MKFHRAYRGHGRHVYTIRAARRYMQDGLHEYDRGLHAEFNEGFFDSKVAAETLQWSDEERDLVERFLLRHGDFGHALYLDPSEPGAKVPSEQPAEIEGQSAKAEIVCIAWDMVDGESKMCGKPVVGDGEFCAKHVGFAEEGVA